MAAAQRHGKVLNLCSLSSFRGEDHADQGRSQGPRLTPTFGTRRKIASHDHPCRRIVSPTPDQGVTTPLVSIRSGEFAEPAPKADSRHFADHKWAISRRAQTGPALRVCTGGRKGTLAGEAKLRRTATVARRIFPWSVILPPVQGKELLPAPHYCTSDSPDRQRIFRRPEISLREYSGRRNMVKRAGLASRPDRAGTSDCPIAPGVEPVVY